jgi:hypothetical protein
MWDILLLVMGQKEKHLSAEIRRFCRNEIPLEWIQGCIP